VVNIGYSMSVNPNIKIIDWAYNILYEGDHRSPLVDKVLDANRCVCECDAEGCDKCDHTGYQGDFHVEWCDPTRTENVYEYINY
jgi:hypothetical protein